MCQMKKWKSGRGKSKIKVKLKMKHRMNITCTLSTKYLPWSRTFFWFFLERVTLWPSSSIDQLSFSHFSKSNWDFENIISANEFLKISHHQKFIWLGERKKQAIEPLLVFFPFHLHLSAKRPAISPQILQQQPHLQCWRSKWYRINQIQSIDWSIEWLSKGLALSDVEWMPH